MQKQDMKTAKENEVKHIKKVSPQPTKIAESPKPQGEAPRTAGGCIPVGA